MGILANAIRTLTGSQLISGRKNTALNVRAVLASIADAVEHLEGLSGVVITVQQSDPINSVGKDYDVWFNNVSLTTERRYIRVNGVWFKFYDNTGGGATPPVKPGAPMIGTVTAGNGTANIPYLAPSSDGGATIFQYHLYRNTVAVGTGTATNPTTAFANSGLTNGMSYSYEVAAENSAGIGPRSLVSNIVIPAAPQTYTSAPQTYTTTSADYTQHCPGSSTPSPYMGVTRTTAAGAVTDTTNQDDVNARALASAKAAAIAAIVCIITYDNIVYGSYILKEITLGADPADSLEFNNLAITYNTPYEMLIYVGGSYTAKVTYATDYFGKAYRFTHGGIQYSGTFSTGQVNY